MKNEIENLGLNEEQLSIIMKGIKEYEDEIERIKKENKIEIDNIRLENEKKVLDYENQIKSIKIENQVENALHKAGAKNIKAVKALLDIENMDFDGQRLVNLDENIQNLVNNAESSFLFEKNEPHFRGIKPEESKPKNIPSKPLNEMTYTELEAYYSQQSI